MTFVHHLLTTHNSNFLLCKSYALQKAVLSKSIARDSLSITGYFLKHFHNESNTSWLSIDTTWVKVPWGINATAAACCRRLAIAVRGFKFDAFALSEAPARLIKSTRAPASRETLLAIDRTLADESTLFTGAVLPAAVHTRHFATVGETVGALSTLGYRPNWTVLSRFL